MNMGFTNVAYFYKDFYGCTASILLRRDGSCMLTMRLPSGDIYKQKNYVSFRNARIALGRMSEGTARPTCRKEC